MARYRFQGPGLGACDFATPAAPSANVTDPAQQQAAIDAAAADQKKAIQQAHDKAKAQQSAYMAGMDKIYPIWSPLPMSPYPPASDTSGFPRTGDPTLVLDRSAITAAALAEPGKISANLVAQAKARTPHVNLFFWVGLACLGGAIYVARNR